MRTTLLTLTVLFSLTTACFSDDMLYKLSPPLEEHPVNLCLSENGKIHVAVANGIFHIDSTYRSGMLELSRDLHVHALHAWKSLVFYANDKQYWQRDEQIKRPRSGYKMLLDQEAITKWTGASASITTFTLDSYGNQFIAVENEARQAALLRRTVAGNVTLELSFNQVPELSRITSMTLIGESSLLCHSDASNTTFILCLLRKKVIGTLPMWPLKSLVYDNVRRLYGIDTLTTNLTVLSVGQVDSHVIKLNNPVMAVVFDSRKNRLLLLREDGVYAHSLGDPANLVNETPLSGIR